MDVQSYTGDILFTTSATERLRILANGNVGIGTISPGYKLDVDGDINTTDGYLIGGKYFMSQGSNEGLKIGINSNSPHTTGYRSVFIGKDAGQSMTETGGGKNVFIGQGAGGNSIQGNENMFLGYTAGSANETGNQNVFIGNQAGYNSQTSNHNTFIGNQAGYSINETGDANNVMVGHFAGRYSTGGARNTFVGTSSGANNTGSNNVFLGYSAGQNAIGSNKLYISNSAIDTPLIYGEFDTQKVIINGSLTTNELLLSDGSVMSSSPWSTNAQNISFTDGNVGIGTNSPSQKLHVNGVGKIKENLLITDNINYLTIYNPISKQLSGTGAITIKVPATSRVLSFKISLLETDRGERAEYFISGMSHSSNNWLKGRAYALGNDEMMKIVKLGLDASGDYFIEMGSTDDFYSNHVRVTVEQVIVTGGSGVYANSENDYYGNWEVTLETSSVLTTTSYTFTDLVPENVKSATTALSPWLTNTSDISFSGGNIGIETSDPLANLHVKRESNNKKPSLLVGSDYNVTYTDTNGSQIGKSFFPIGDIGYEYPAIVGLGTSYAALDIPSISNYGSVGVVGAGGFGSGGRTNVGVYGYAYMNQGQTTNGGNTTIGGLFKSDLGVEVDDFRGSIYGLKAVGEIGAGSVSETHLYNSSDPNQNDENIVTNGKVYGIYAEAKGTVDASYPQNMTTTYAGYFKATEGTNNYAIYSSEGLNYFQDNVGIGIDPNTLDPSVALAVGGKVGIGTGNPQSTFEVRSSDSSTEYWNAQTLSASITNNSPTAQAAKYFINNDMAVNGTYGNGNIIGSHNMLRIQNSSMSNSARTLYGRVNMTGQGSANSVALMSTHFEGNSTGTLNNFYGMAIGSLGGVSGFSNGTTTINNTYGLFIGDITAGNQTNVPYSVYASDEETNNFFAGNVGIGTDLTNNPNNYKLDVNGTINATDVLINGLPISNSTNTWDQVNDDLHYTLGNVGIGTAEIPEGYSLAVDGKAIMEQVKVQLSGDWEWPDYVLQEGYDLLSLKDTKEYIRKNGTLPEIPSAKEIQENGIDLGDMNLRLLKKIEELTLYQIDLLERIESLESQH